MSDPRIAQRLNELPPYLFDAIDQQKRAALGRGVDVVDLGVGDPDLPTPEFIISAMSEAIRRPAHHQYPPYRGTTDFRQAVAQYLKRRFEVSVEAETETLCTIGSKEAIAHLALALINPGDTILVPDPAYPVYAQSARFLGAEVVHIPLRREHGFLPRLDEIPTETAARARLLWINYPNNPTGAVAPRSFYEEVASFAQEFDLTVASDAAYAEIYLEGDPPPSGMQVEALRPRLVEFHSLSKTFNMTGWRLGFAVGAPWVISALGTVKTNVDSGTFAAVQEAGSHALRSSFDTVETLRETYRRRRRLLCAGLEGAGLERVETTGSFFVLVAVPSGHTSISFASHLLEQAGIVCTPCVGFGEGGEGYVRFSLTAADERLEEASRRLGQLRQS